MFRKSQVGFIAGLCQASVLQTGPALFGLTELLHVILVSWLLTARLPTQNKDPSKGNRIEKIQNEGYSPSTNNLTRLPNAFLFLTTVFLICLCALVLYSKYQNHAPYSTLKLVECFFFFSKFCVTVNQSVSMARGKQYKWGHQLVYYYWYYGLLKFMYSLFPKLFSHNSWCSPS